jgi:integrase
LEDTNVRRSGSGDAERIAFDCPLLRAFASRQNDFVFPGYKQGWSLSDISLLILLRELRPGITTHGFRSTFKDWAAEMTNAPNFVSEAALAHVVADKVEAAYRRADLFGRRRKLMDAWGRFCTRLASDVVVLEHRRS